MGLLKRLLGGRSAGLPADASASQFHDSETTTQHAADSAPRRELVQVVLRDTMRKHGIPSDWMDCRILLVPAQRGQTGMHLQFIVRQGDDQLLPFVHAFQSTFWQELEKFEPNPRNWLLSVAWQFDGPGNGASAQAAQGWANDTQPPDETRPPEQDPEELASDLQALYAIRDAALSEPTPLAGSEKAKPPRS